ncbi:MAG: hypothetical protein B6241_12455 [Spirochaetaceae bacterium 4572_59]|nr:MAG: hypothetical protein B6241_12455 [Spirochaetaceae bacterium 4572_59]
MMILKDRILVTRKSGHWEGNRWVNDSSKEPVPMRASVQPSPGDGMDSSEEGRRRKSEISITTKKPLYASDKNRNADIVEWNNEKYEIKTVKPWGTGTRLAHYKALAESLEDHADETL